MDKLEFEYSDVSGQKPKDISSSSVDGDNGAMAIEFSVKVVALLCEKVKAHNKGNSSKRVTLQQLKKVYYYGAKNFCEEDHEDKSAGEWALARVNMFLRIKSGEKSFDDLVFDEAINFTSNKFIDLSESWTPDEKDIISAREDIKENELNYDFKDINELYLEDYRDSRVNIYYN